MICWDVFGTLCDMRPAFKRASKEFPTLFDTKTEKEAQKWTVEAMMKAIYYAPKLFRPPNRLISCYYTDVPGLPLEAVRDWLVKHRFPPRRIVRVRREDLDTYRKLAKYYGKAGIADDNPPIPLLYSNDVNIFVPVREWNKWIKETERHRKFEDVRDLEELVYAMME